MLIANDSNYTFGQFLEVEDGDDIKAPVYSKCFTDTEALKGYRFIHDPEETDPEKCVCFSIYDETSSAALSTPFEEFASVSDLTSVMFRLDTKIVEGVLRDAAYYHVIVPVLNIVEETVEYLVIKMTKEVELFPENYPYYELVDTFADAEPTSAEAPGGGGDGGGGGGDGDIQFIKLATETVDDKLVSADTIRTILDTVKTASGQIYYFEFTAAEVESIGYLPNVKYFIQQYFDLPEDNEFGIICTALFTVDGETVSDGLTFAREGSSDSDKFVFVDGTN